MYFGHQRHGYQIVLAPWWKKCEIPYNVCPTCTLQGPCSTFAIWLALPMTQLWYALLRLKTRLLCPISTNASILVWSILLLAMQNLPRSSHWATLGLFWCARICTPCCDALGQVQGLHKMQDTILRVPVVVNGTHHVTLGYVCASSWQTITRCGGSCRSNKAVAPVIGIGSNTLTVFSLQPRCIKKFSVHLSGLLKSA